MLTRHASIYPPEPRPSVVHVHLSGHLHLSPCPSTRAPAIYPERTTVHVHVHGRGWSDEDERRGGGTTREQKQPVTRIYGIHFSLGDAPRDCSTHVRTTWSWPWLFSWWIRPISIFHGQNDRTSAEIYARPGRRHGHARRTGQRWHVRTESQSMCTDEFPSSRSIRSIESCWRPSGRRAMPNGGRSSRRVGHPNTAVAVAVAGDGRGKGGRASVEEEKGRCWLLTNARRSLPDGRICLRVTNLIPPAASSQVSAARVRLALSGSSSRDFVSSSISAWRMRAHIVRFFVTCGF